MITEALYDVLAGDTVLQSLLSTYKGKPAVFTIDPAPKDAVLPYIVAASIPVQIPSDTKTSRGRVIWRDIRIYDAQTGSAALIESIAERVRELLHRELLIIPGYSWLLTECAGPISADEDLAYGRIVTAKITLQQI
jgi:hypothetical protein